ncbi:MAG: hypothetical protein K1Y01_11245, partial [Vicinamibacteria bacterium]|nr:hypothetical protein [Vicinamibacteria bacterium]
PPAPSVSRPDLPPWIDRVVLKCLEKEPSRRFQTAAALAQELRLTRTGGVTRPRRLPSGDSVVIPGTTAAEWALILSSPAEKPGWTPAMALRFEGRTFRLVRVDPPHGGKGRWTYRFAPWPEGELMRRIVEYDPLG